MFTGLQYPPSTFQNPTMDRPPAIGRVFYVRSTGANTNNGVDPGTPFQTITYALAQCVDWRNDYIVLMNNTSPNEPAWPIDIELNMVHIIGLWGSPYPNPTLMAVGDFATLRIMDTFMWVEIAGLELGGGATNGCIQIGPDAPGPGITGHNWIHHCSFGYITALVTAQDGIRVPVGNADAQTIIENNIFGSALTRDGIRLDGNSTRSILRNNLFRLVPGIGINVNINGGDLGAILDNKFSVADAVAGEAITFAFGAGNAMVTGNVAANADNPMLFNPYRDLSTGVAGTGLNDWGMNWASNAVIFPNTA